MFRIRVMQLSDAMKKFILSAIMFLCALSSPAQTIDIERLNGKSRLICNFLQVFEAQSKRSSPWAELRSLL